MTKFPFFISKICRFLSLKNPNIPPPLPNPLSFPPTKQEFSLVFRFFDKDGDGKISASELYNSMSSSIGEQPSQAEVSELVESSDSDGDGKLGYEDFMRLVEMKELEDEERCLREAFAAYEAAGKGFITARSLRRGLRRLGEETTVEKCKNMIERFDLDGDGVISFEEFKIMMML